MNSTTSRFRDYLMILASVLVVLAAWFPFATIQADDDDDDFLFTIGLVLLLGLTFLSGDETLARALGGFFSTPCDNDIYILRKKFSFFLSTAGR
jgi:hypothetical protein